MTHLPKELVERVEAWLTQDPDFQTRAELEDLLAAGDEANLRDRFDARIGFGTAGLRGALGAGPNRMNRVLVAQAAAGIATYLKAIGGTSVVIGYDGRLSSDVFARDSARIFAGAGLDVLLFDDYTPTPMLAFATKRGPVIGGEAFDIGVMVTASHNPPRDNGYKVYAGSLGGSQIISPLDKEISAAIEAVAAGVTFAQIPVSDDYSVGGQEIRDEYIRHGATLALDGQRNPVDITFTAMHGVGWATTEAMFRAAGLAAPMTVPEQIEPDGQFPTVVFPNPEEPGALDMAFARARINQSDLILAEDPDADRLAVAIPDASSETGWLKLTGDQIGFLLGAEAAERAVTAGLSGTLACSIASSSALARVAAHYGLEFKQTLTGFKWISKVPGLIFGYEEALGYCFDPTRTPDKDGITAALVVADLAGRLAHQGTTIGEELDRLYEKFGHWATSQITLRFDNVAKAAAIVASVRQAPPSELLGQAPHYQDLALGSAELPPTDGLRFVFSDGRTALIRPSGTEPKLKCYLEATGDSAAEAQERLKELELAFRKLLSA